MKDSVVGPAGLFDVRRQERLLAGLADRIASTRQQQAALSSQHAAQSAEDEVWLAGQRAAVLEACRTDRRDTLDLWDQSEEELTHAYESAAVTHRIELNRLAVIFRRRLAEETKAIERKVEARRQAVLQQYENRKNQPGQISRKEIKRIDDSLASLHGNLEWARALTIRRLDRLPDVSPSDDPADDMRVATPASVAETIDSIGKLTRQSTHVVEEMQSGMASHIVDRFYLPAGVAAFIVIWAIVAFFFAPPPPYKWMALGILPAGVIGFAIYLILLWPLKRMTRRLYPKVERIGQAAEDCAAAGRDLSTKVANDASAELVNRRDSHVQAAQRWRDEQIVALEKRLNDEQTKLRQKLVEAIANADRQYGQQSVAVATTMRNKAESVAANISARLTSTDQSLDQIRREKAGARAAELQHLSDRLHAGVRRGLDRIRTTGDAVARCFPDWDEIINQPQLSQGESLDFIPVGSLGVGDRLKQLPMPDVTDRDVERIPVALHRRLQSCLVIQAHESSMGVAVDAAHQVLWRLLAGARPARAKLTLLDPMGRGQHFTSFMALTDHDPSIVGHRVWTTDQKIEARLAELAHHVEDILQASLRDRFQRIEDYNQVAGSMAEPYRGIAAVGFPEGLSRQSYSHLRALIENGLRCGIFTVLVCDAAKPWPSDMPLPAGDKVLSLRVDQNRVWTLAEQGLDELPFNPGPLPPSSIRPQLIDKIGRAAVAASRVEIPLDAVLSDATEGAGSTSDGIAISVGSQGASRSLAIRLGEGVRQHVLIAGKTGSGKSTLLHSIITAGAYDYRPDQLQFYLLDFKKGVEFKPYADIGLPHVRVIGIESEREFGRSVLQRLDVELQERGEKFRDAGVQELGEYRSATGQPMARIMLVVDEFQELFVRDDRIAGDCAMLLDRLVRQGRSFGMHVILSSQSLAGAYSLPRATLGQMAVRIAMQCSESDAALILSDDNTAARLINRPGEAIYNDAGGLVEGNQPFQVAWLSSSRHRELLGHLVDRDQEFVPRLAPMVVFEGNRPCRWTPVLASTAIADSGDDKLTGLLGESVEIGPPVCISLARNTGRNVLVIAAPEPRAAMLASTISGFAKSMPAMELIYFDGSRVDDGESIAAWLTDAGVGVKTIRPRDSADEMVGLGELIQMRGDDSGAAPPVVIVIDGLERFRDLRQDDSFNFSLDAAGGTSASASLQSVLRDGPAAGLFTIVVCGSAEILSRWLPRATHHDLELRVLGQMNPSDSSILVDSPIASELSAATMLMYDDADGRITKFRQTDLPAAPEVKAWLRG